MAQPNGVLNMYTRERDCWTIHFSCVGAGAANPTSPKGTGIVSVVRTAAGKYTIHLKDRWAGLLNWGFSVQSPTTVYFDVYLITQDLPNKALTIEVVNKSGVLTDLTLTTAILKGTLEFTNSVQVPHPY